MATSERKAFYGWNLMRSALAIALLLASTQASAFVPRKLSGPMARMAAARQSAASRTRALTASRSLTSTPPPSAQRAFSRLAAHGWHASWDGVTGVPAWLTGAYVDAPGAVDDPARAEAAALAFLATNLDVLAPGATMNDFVIVTNQLDGELRTVAFEQRWRGMRVVGGQIGVVAARDRLFAVSSAAWPHVDAKGSRGQRQTTATQAQKLRAEAWVLSRAGVIATARPTGERVVVPTIRAGDVEYVVGDVHDVALASGERWTVYAAPDGTPIDGHESVMYGSATLQYNVGIRYGSGARANYPAPRATMTVDGTPTTTTSDGTFSWPGTSAATVIPGLVGPEIRIINEAGALAMDTLTAQPAGIVVWMRSLTELMDAQISTFVYGSMAKARARLINPSVAAWLDMQLDFHVNKDGACQAFSSGDDVQLYRSDATCENTGRVSDIVFHEVGHTLHKHSVIGGMGAFEPHLSEGLADFFAANLTGDQAVGRGLFKNDDPMREIDPPGYERLFPIDVDVDPHVSGLIIGGALWDLRKAFIADLGHSVGIERAERIFTGIMQRASSIGATFTAALIADDDDGNLGNGTPNACAIERAFGAHGLVPSYAATRLDPPQVDGLAISMSVTTPASAACPLATVSSIVVTWRANDGVASQLTLDPGSGDPSVWTGTLPEQSDGTLVTYSADVHFDDGSVRSFPDNPADPRYQLFTGGATPVWCETFDADPAWAQTSNTSFEWEWGSPQADIGTRDPDGPSTGSAVLGTRLGGTGAYRPSMRTSVQSPVIDVSAYEIVRLQYSRWLTVEDSQFDQATIHANGTEVWRNATAKNGILDHIDREWRFHDIDLTPHVVDGTVALSWALWSDLTKQLGGWTLDDVCIVGLAKVPRCGDGDVDIGEQCDDGNRRSDDGCTRECIDEVTAGGGGCCSATGGDERSLLVLGLAVTLGLRRRRPRLRIASRSATQA